VSAIAGFVTRADWGARPPRSVSRSIQPQRGGVTFHYGGPAQRLRGQPHAACVRRWKAWQEFHMKERGWSDLAYTGGVCDHGYAFAGRGAGIRTAANGTNAGNLTHYAICWLGGEGETPTAEALAAFGWWVNELRANGGAGPAVNTHSDHKSTACAGDAIRRALRAGTIPLTAEDEDGTKAVTEEDDVLKSGDKGGEVRMLQEWLNTYHNGRKDHPQGIMVDGDFGNHTKAAVVLFQKKMGYKQSGVYDLPTAIRLQQVMFDRALRAAVPKAAAGAGADTGG
jgi:hypothetical protein